MPQNTLTKLLFDASRLLSVVPALLGASINAWCLWSPPGYTTPLYRRTHCTERWGRKSLPDRGDYFLAVLWVRRATRSRPLFSFLLNDLPFLSLSLSSTRHCSRRTSVWRSRQDCSGAGGNTTTLSLPSSVSSPSKRSAGQPPTSRSTSSAAGVPTSASPSSTRTPVPSTSRPIPISTVMAPVWR